jgi:acetyltransferase-like isoleucine patch superfamily enzyme
MADLPPRIAAPPSAETATAMTAPAPAPTSAATPMRTQEPDVQAPPQMRSVTPGYLYVAADLMTLLYECALYLAAATPLALMLYRERAWPPVGLLALAVGGYLLTAVAFLALLVVTKRLLIGEVATGRYFLNSPRAWRWIASDRVIKILVRSPFHALVTENACFRHGFYRAMGAQVHYSLMLGNGVRFPEPWALRIGRQVLIGDQAMVSGHKVERGVVTLGMVEIGDGCVIGARSLILPDTVIGAGAIIGAQSVVVQGTRVPPRQTWAGNPARRVDAMAAGPASRAGASTTAPMGDRHG